MAINKKSLFNPVFKVEQLAGFQSRFKSLDSLIGSTPHPSPNDADGSHLFHESELKKKFKTMQTPAILPSMKLRKEGKL